MAGSTRNCAIVFYGELVPGIAPRAISERLMAMFKLDSNQAARLLEGKNKVLKKGLTPGEASQLQATLRQAGLICHIIHTSGAPLSPPRMESTTKISQETIDASFNGNFEAVPVNHRYLAALFGTAALMLLLLLSYFGIIALTAYGTLWHISNNLGNALSNINLIAVALYLAPIVAGFTLILVLIKPIFAHTITKPQAIALDPVRHRRFFHFVECICKKTGAPVPAEIHVDGYVNASARLKHGVFSDQLILTVGMPLIMGLNTRDLAGVLAHEFGHFSQRYAMKLGYVINEINYWFYRVVHQRDSWDACIDRWSTKSDNVYLAMTGRLTRLSVWSTRRILHGLMLLGILMSRYMSRQMEFDADLYSARICGSHHYQRMALAVKLLSVAFANAHQRNMAAWNEGHVTDNLPQLTANFAATLPASIRRKLKHEIHSGNCRRWDTHPSDAERIERATAQHFDGIFKLELPASLLIYDHERLSRLTTLNYYMCEGIQISESRLVTPEQILASAVSRGEGQAALDHYFNGVFQPNRIIPLPSPSAHTAVNTASLQRLIEELHLRRPEAKALLQQYESCASRLALMRSAFALAESGLPFDIRSYDLPSRDKRTVEIALNRAAADFYDRDKRLLQYEELMGHRLGVALNEACSQADDGSREQLLREWQALYWLSKVREMVANLISYGFVLEQLYNGCDRNDGGAHVCKNYLRLCNREIDQIQTILNNCQSPFTLNTRQSLGRLLEQRIEEYCVGARNEIEVCLATKRAMLGAIFHLNSRISGALAIHATQAERSLEIKGLRMASGYR